MSKEATTTFPVSPLFSKRWSPRAFSEKAIDDEQLKTIIEAASWAPSAMNEQPWRYIVAKKGSEGFESVWNCLMGGNQPWAKNAAALIVAVAQLNHASNGQANPAALHDLGLANATLALQAFDLGIYSHFMGGFFPDKVKDFAQLADDQQPMCVIALGYLGDPETLEEPFKTRELTPRTRKSIDEIAKFL